MLKKIIHSKNHHLITNFILTFWFGWFSLAGIGLTVIFVWLDVLPLNREEIVVTGSVLGIISGGIATFFLFIINRRNNNVNHFEEDRHFFSVTDRQR